MVEISIQCVIHVDSDLISCVKIETVNGYHYYVVCVYMPQSNYTLVSFKEILDELCHLLGRLNKQV